MMLCELFLQRKDWQASMLCFFCCLAEHCKRQPQSGNAGAALISPALLRFIQQRLQPASAWIGSFNTKQSRRCTGRIDLPDPAARCGNFLRNPYNY